MKDGRINSSFANTMTEQGTVYETIGEGYNATRQADPFLTERFFHLLQALNNGLYLDIGCGTGNYTIALAGRGLNFYGVDPSEKMLAEARLRAGK